MPSAVSIFGRTHKYHTGSKFTFCGKKLKNMSKHRKSKKLCSACWN